MLKTILQKPFAHAYLFPSESKGELLDFLEMNAVEEKAEIVMIESVQFGIAESRALIESAQVHSLTDKKYIVVIASELTVEAQHSLLKLFEEPPMGVHFFLVTPRPHSLLATLRSRCVLFGAKPAEKHAASKFIPLSLKDKFTFIAKLVDSHKDVEEGIILKQDAEKLFDEVLVALSSNKTDGQSLKKINDILDLKSHLFSRGASVKQLLETMAILTE